MSEHNEPGHNSNCGCFMCEDNREFAGAETLGAKEARIARENAPRSTCICTDLYMSSHSYACRNQAELNKPTFYIASRASILARPQRWCDMRDKQGIRIISTWIDDAVQGGAPNLEGLWERIVAEITRCDCLVLYVEPEDFPLKGAFVEVGMALALDKPVRIVAHGLVVDPVDCKPLGSWAKHPNVRFMDTVENAFSTVGLSAD
jgi:hypothetical protein